jgi:hypothetical protein
METMLREALIERQVQWKNTLQEYGCKVTLEKTVYIRNTPVIVDVFAEVDEKKFLIEIGNVVDKLKNALMQFYAEENSNIEFIHESYGRNEIPTVLESISAYIERPEYTKLKNFKEGRKNFIKSWTGLCAFAFVISIFGGFNPQSWFLLWGVLVIPFVWLFILAIGNLIYSDKERKVSEELSESN